jgi:glycolate oxidase iron-sulfur subunit
VGLTSTGPAPADLSQCVHCGLCLQNCPTYLLTGYEAESPRGRIHLIQALNEGRVEPNEAYRQHIELCLVCRNCESVCPSGVHFGRIMEAARAQLYESEYESEKARLPLAERIFRRLAFHELLPHRIRLRVLFGLLTVYQQSGLQALIRASRLLPAPLAEAESLLPELPRPFLPRWEVYPAEGNTGERQVARDLARQNLQAFLGRGLDAIVVNSAGCGAVMKEYPELLDDAEAAEFGRLTRDVTEFLASIELAPFQRPVPRTVTLQESCHLVHAQRIKDAPRQLLAVIPGIELRDMAHPDLCCGSAGLYMLTEPEMSTRILDDKMQDVASTGAQTIVTANPGCMMQLQRGVRRAGISGEVKHVVELVDEAYQTRST